MIEFNTTRWVTGSEAASLAGVTENALRKRRAYEDSDRHPRYVSVGPNAVLYPEGEFLAYVATWTDERRARTIR